VILSYRHEYPCLATHLAKGRFLVELIPGGKVTGPAVRKLPDRDGPVFYHVSKPPGAEPLAEYEASWPHIRGRRKVKFEVCRAAIVWVVTFRFKGEPIEILIHENELGWGPRDPQGPERFEREEVL
jgi:hypothetical protein